jgi:hypothetical protein
MNTKPDVTDIIERLPSIKFNRNLFSTFGAVSRTGKAWEINTTLPHAFGSRTSKSELLKKCPYHETRSAQGRMTVVKPKAVHRSDATTHIS